MTHSTHTITPTCIDAPRANAPVSFAMRLPVMLLSALSSVMSTRRTRAHLAHLDAAALCDIGITSDQARTEATRPFWDVPATWRD